MTKVWTVTMNPAIDLGAEVESVVPDAKLRCSQPSIEPGGGGVNVSRALRRVDAGSTAVFPEGPGLGEFYRHLVEAEGVDCRTFGIRRPMHRISNHFRETESRRQYRFSLPGPELEESEWRAALDLVRDMLDEKDILVMSGSLPPGVPARFTRLLAEVAAEARASFVLDAPGEVLDELKQTPVRWITPNRKEFEELIGHRVDADRLEEELEALVADQDKGFENVLLTLGAEGALCAGAEGAWRIRAPEVEKVSAVGAGDSSVAGLVLGLIAGKDHRTASEWAVAAGAAAVMSPGTELLSKKDFANTRSKKARKIPLPLSIAATGIKRLNSSAGLAKITARLSDSKQPNEPLDIMNKIRIHTIRPLNHNVRRLVTDKPDGYDFKPGQATLVAVDKEGLRDEKRPFTFTSLPSEDHLEFTIKIYPSHEGVTDAIDDLKEGDDLLIEDPWGAITFQGKGVFIAGGAGLTPMLAILKDQADRKSDAVEGLIFSNKKEKDLFLKEDLEVYTNGNLLLTFTEETVEGAEKGRVDKDFLEKHIRNFDQFFYVCGPPEMVESVSSDLKDLGADPDKIVTEES